MDDQVRQRLDELEHLVIKAIRKFENETGKTVVSVMIAHHDNPESEREDLKLKIEIG